MPPKQGPTEHQHARRQDGIRGELTLLQELKRILFGPTRRRVAFLVGAGVSMPPPSSMLSGAQLLEELVSRIAPDDRARRQLLRLCDAERRDRRSKGDFLRLESVMEHVSRMDPGLHVLDCLVRHSTPNLDHYVIAGLMARGHIILTTNFDVLIEHACHQLNVGYSVFSTDQEFETYNPRRDTHPLFKLHGSLQRYRGHMWVDSRESVQATLAAVAQSGERMEFEAGKRRIVQRIIESHDMVVLGYSGYDDFDIVPALTTTRSLRSLLWIRHDLASSRRYTWANLNALLGKGRSKWVDVSDTFRRPSLEHVHRMGQYARTPEKVRLYDWNTDQVMSKILQALDIRLPALRSTPSFDRKAYFDAWAAAHVSREWLKGYHTGSLFYSLGRREEARANFEKGRRTALRMKDLGGMSDCTHYLATIQVERGRSEIAFRLFRHCLSLADQLGTRTGTDFYLLHMGIIRQEAGSEEEALRYYRDGFARATDSRVLRHSR